VTESSEAVREAARAAMDRVPVPGAVVGVTLRSEFLRDPEGRVAWYRDRSRVLKRS
jgi:hypothetical protein